MRSSPLSVFARFEVADDDGEVDKVANRNGGAGEMFFAVGWLEGYVKVFKVFHVFTC